METPSFGDYMKEDDLDISKCTLIQALNFYRLNYTQEDSKRWALQWLEKNDPSEAIRLSKVKEHEFTNRGFVCRLMDRGFPFTDVQSQKLIHYLKNINLSPISLIEPQETEETPAPKPHSKPPAINTTIIQLEDAVDAILSDKEPPFVCVTLNESQIIETKKWCEKEIVELHETIHKFNKMLNLLTSVFVRCGGVEKALRKPVATKPQPPSKVDVSGVTYQKEDAELGIKSIHPSKIVGASVAFVYQVKYRILMKFVAVNGSKLTIVGSSVRGFDMELSSMKSIRKPKEFFKDRSSYDDYECIDGKVHTITSHISKDMVILSADKG